MPEPIEVLAERLRSQAATCAALGSPFYASLLEAAADDLEMEGPVVDVLQGFESESAWAAIALRLMAAVHRQVLSGELAELDRHYPSTGGDGDAAAAWPVFKGFVSTNRDWVRGRLGHGCQTNEVGRSAALVGGFLEVAHRTHLPLRILEIGASAGLNLRWDRYRYESSEGAWGDPSSHVRLTHSFEIPPPLNRTADVVERMGCDLNPIDPTTEEGALTLRSFIWADQLSRLAQLDGAIDIAREVPAVVEKIDAAAFLERELLQRNDGVATVVFHSVFTQYLEEPARARIAAALGASDAFRLSLENSEGVFEIRLDDELLGTSLAHGTGVRWVVDSTPR